MTTNAAFERSERIRQRRTQRSQERQTRSASYARTPAPAPTRVTSRSGMGSPILNRAATPQPRRKYFVSLTRDSEMALPALPVIQASWRLLSGLVVLAMLILLGLILFGPLFQVKEITFTGLERANKANLEAILDLRNISIVNVNPLLLQEKLAAKFPELASVAISADLPNNITVAVRERQPVTAWKVKDKLYWIDSEGILFEANGEVSGLLTIISDDLPPLVQEKTAPQPAGSAALDSFEAYQALSIKPKQQVAAGLLNAALILTTQMPANSGLVYSKTSGLGWTDERGWKVYFGLDLANIDAKLNLYQAIVDQLTQNKIKPSLISVEQIHAPFYRLEH